MLPDPAPDTDTGETDRRDAALTIATEILHPVQQERD
jgi:hypothetical protein